MITKTLRAYSTRNLRQKQNLRDHGGRRGPGLPQKSGQRFMRLLLRTRFGAGGPRAEYGYVRGDLHRIDGSATGECITRCDEATVGRTTRRP
jgi:hypothetical protein